MRKLILKRVNDCVVVRTTTPIGHDFDVIVKFSDDCGLSVELFTGGNFLEEVCWEWSGLDLYPDSHPIVKELKEEMGSEET